LKYFQARTLQDAKIKSINSLNAVRRHQVKVHHIDFETASIAGSDEVMYSVMVTLDAQLPAMELLEAETSS
jgi:hypothetical protein